MMSTATDDDVIHFLSSTLAVSLTSPRLCQSGQVTLPLFDPATAAPDATNQQFMREYVANLLATSFPNLTRPMIHAFVLSLFDVNSDLQTFKANLRDFLIQLKVRGAERVLRVLGRGAGDGRA
jgi:hypothetical protein